MLHQQLPFYLAIIILIILLILLANKLRVAYPILLVLGGLGISLVPGVPVVKIDPDLIFILFLPPLLYEAAWSISFKDLWKWRRIISSFAFVVVFLSATAVAIVSNHFIPGFSLALGFLLGGIVSPPDAVSAGAIMKFVKVPARFKSIVEGESLFNDASSLIIFRFALVAVGTGQFVAGQAVATFFWMVLGGIAIGLLLAYIFYEVHRLLPTNAEMDIVLTFVAPYVMYLAAEAVDSSGVMSVVTGGLFLANRSHMFLTSAGRIKSHTVWQSISFMLNGLVFILIGLDLPEIAGGLEGVSMRSAIGYGVLITGVLVLVRIVSAYGAMFFTLLLRDYISVADRGNPGYKTPFLLGWAGMRGVVSLAAALSIPVHLADGTLFPQRNLILFITFVVILLTLVVQGLTLPYLIRKIPILREGESLPDDTQYYALYSRLRASSCTYIGHHYAGRLQSHAAFQSLLSKYEDADQPDAGMDEAAKAIMLEVIERQREWLREWNKEEGLDETYVKKHFYRLDLEEESLGLK